MCSCCICTTLTIQRFIAKRYNKQSNTNGLMMCRKRKQHTLSISICRVYISILCTIGVYIDDSRVYIKSFFTVFQCKT